MNCSGVAVVVWWKWMVAMRRSFQQVVVVYGSIQRIAFATNSGKRGGSQTQSMVVLAVTVLRSGRWHKWPARSVSTCARGASRLLPEEVGLAAAKRRRVAGLRREELATLAGISSAYYLRLEQGRATSPSAQVVDALARALRLDARSTQYLHDLAGPAGRIFPDPDVSAHALAEVIDQFLMPAIVVNRYRDVLAANPIARALSPEFTPGENFRALATTGPCGQAVLRQLGRGDRQSRSMR